MQLNSEQLSRLQRCQAEILGTFAQICDKIGVKYYILGGTLLGAVRHEGCIPWDDDVDVFIPREEYDIFLEKAPDMLPEKYFLQTHNTDENYPNNYAKLRDSSTTFVEKTVRSLKINHGVYIDIFPLDYYPDGFKAKIFELKKRLLTIRINLAFDFENRSLKSKIASAIALVLHLSLERAILKREKLFSSVHHGKRRVNNSGAWLEKEIVPAEWCDEGVMLNFEGMQLRGSAHYHEWLTFVYGDYMTLPPESKRISHHTIEYFDMDKPYTEYIK